MHAARPDQGRQRLRGAGLSLVGRLLYRRPLTATERAAYVSQAGAAANRLKDFYAGLSVTLEGLLIAPEALFIVDRSEPDPQHPGQRRLDAYSLASRLSFFLWNAAPDDELLKAAERGELQTAQGRARVVDRMLAARGSRPACAPSSTTCWASTTSPSWPRIRASIRRSPPTRSADAREQTLRTIVDQLIVKNGDYRDLFTTRDTFISPSLAALYGVPAPPGWTRLSSSRRTARASGC